VSGVQGNLGGNVLAICGSVFFAKEIIKSYLFVHNGKVNFNVREVQNENLV
jgi:hypothetical protein